MILEKPEEKEGRGVRSEVVKMLSPPPSPSFSPDRGENCGRKSNLQRLIRVNVP
jgi:hypothetical protein